MKIYSSLNAVQNSVFLPQWGVVNHHHDTVIDSIVNERDWKLFRGQENLT